MSNLKLTMLMLFYVQAIGAVSMALYYGGKVLFRWLLTKKTKIKKENIEYIWVGIVVVVFVAGVLCLEYYDRPSGNLESNSLSWEDQDDVPGWLMWGFIGFVIFAIAVKVHGWVKSRKGIGEK